MKQRDLPAVLRIERATYSLAWSMLFFVRALRAGWSCWVLQDNRGVLLGYGVMRCSRGWAHIMNLCVAPGRRRRGLGRMLLLHLLDQARSLGARQAWLEVRPTNVPAIRLYEQLGFQRKYRRRSYYPDPNGYEDALVMARRL